MEYGDAWEIVTNEALAAAIAAAKNKKEVEEIVNAFKEAKVAAEAARTPLEKLEDVADEVNQLFSRKRNSLEAQFIIDTADFQKTIMAAQDEIEGLNYKLDDYNAGLQEIEWQEEEVNKKYEARFEALNKIQEANQSITDQVKSQLDIADALSKGDISAAARAVQELREKQAAKSIDTQRKALESAQEKELAALVSSNGMTRKQLEDLILQTQKDIFAIEEKRLEPAQRAIELKQNELDLSLFSLDQQQAAWEIVYNNILNAVDPLKTYVELLKEAQGVLSSMGKMSPSSGTPVWNEKNAAGDQVWDGKKFIPINKNPNIGGTIAGPENPGNTYGEVSKNGNWVWDGIRWRKIDPNASYSGNLPGPENPGKNPGDLSENKQWQWDGTTWQKLAKGGMVVKKFAMGGVVPKKFFLGGIAKEFASGTDTVPAMLTPGEFVVRKQAVDRVGVNTLSSINKGEPVGSSVYNSYSVDVNVATNANPDQIANTVIREIKRIDSQRIKGNKF
jgi:tetratricopeptide (TPR) repeat protein